MNEISLMQDYPFRSPVKHQGNKWNHITNESPSYQNDSISEPTSSEEENLAIGEFKVSPVK